MISLCTEISHESVTISLKGQLESIGGILPHSLCLLPEFSGRLFVYVQEISLLLINARLPYKGCTSDLTYPLQGIRGDLSVELRLRLRTGFVFLDTGKHFRGCSEPFIKDRPFHYQTRGGWVSGHGVLNIWWRRTWGPTDSGKSAI